MSVSSSSPVKRVRWSDQIDDADSVSSSSSSPRVVPKTPRMVRAQSSLFPPSPPLSDSSLGDEHQHYQQQQQQFIHLLLLPGAIFLDARAVATSAVIPATPNTPFLRAITDQFTTPATHPPQRRMNLICPFLPWAITVENPKGVSIGDVLFRITECLYRTASKDEYNACNSLQQADILKAYQKNVALAAASPAGLKPRSREDGIKRIDWLGKRTVFAGIRKDEKFIAQSVQDLALRAETYVLDFAAPPS